MIILLIVLAVVAMILIGVYNSLVRKKNQTENAFGTIDVMLKKRYDLIPNMVATVQQYAQHEQETLTQVTQLRTNPYAQMTEADKGNFDKQFSAASRSFVAMVERYPDLKASENFMNLQRTLNETEEQLSAARRTFNAAVTDYNNSVETFPSNIIAGMFGFPRKAVLETPAEERVTPNVKNLFNS